MKIQSSQQLSTTSGIKVLIYGNAGMGKTLLAATAPAPVLLSAESGLLSLSKRNIERVYGVDTPGITYDIPVIIIKTVEDISAAYTWLTTSKDAQGFQTIVIDSISEIAEVILANAKPQVKDARLAYGTMMEQMANTVRLFRDQPKNVYFTAKSELVKDENGVAQYAPSLPGNKMSQQIPYWLDEVFNLGMGTTADGSEYRYLRTSPTMKFTAKDRSGSLEAMEEPHLGKIFSKILEDCSTNQA